MSTFIVEITPDDPVDFWEINTPSSDSVVVSHEHPEDRVFFSASSGNNTVGFYLTLPEAATLSNAIAQAVRHAGG